MFLGNATHFSFSCICTYLVFAGPPVCFLISLKNSNFLHFVTFSRRPFCPPYMMRPNFPISDNTRFGVLCGIGLDSLVYSLFWMPRLEQSPHTVRDYVPCYRPGSQSHAWHSCSFIFKFFHFLTWQGHLLQIAVFCKNLLLFQVLVIEPTKVYQPSYVSINNEAEERTVSLWHVSPTEMVRGKS